MYLFESQEAINIIEQHNNRIRRLGTKVENFPTIYNTQSRLDRYGEYIESRLTAVALEIIRLTAMDIRLAEHRQGMRGGGRARSRGDCRGRHAEAEQSRGRGSRHRKPGSWPQSGKSR